MSISDISNENFFMLLEGAMPSSGVGASYNLALLKTIVLEQEEPFTTKQAAATLGESDTGRIGAILNKWENNKLLVKAKPSNRAIWFPRDKVPEEVLEVYDSRKAQALEAIALTMPE